MITLDMFEVQLGSAILLTFDTGEGPVRVLADGGVGHHTPVKSVHEKISTILGRDGRRIDLIIGTHYDQDHLKGLVPVIEDESIEIGEAWMPPVANDTQQFAVDGRVAPADLLAHQFAREDGRTVLETYLNAKRQDIELLLELETVVSGEPADRLLSVKTLKAGAYDDPIDFFRAQLTGDSDDCADHGVSADEPNPVFQEMLSQARKGYYTFYHSFDTGGMERLKAWADEHRSAAPALAMARGRSLSHMRKRVASEAINAKALQAVVQALTDRKITIRTEIIEDGLPRRYRWASDKQRFLLSKSVGQGLGFTLLGPSRGLVQKHRDKLPVIETSKAALTFRGEIRGITESNQLSYIGCFSHAGQRILIAGDAGCVDFPTGRNSYHPALLAELKPLHVVQIAHHGGSNAYFYRVLDAAGYPEQQEPSWMLLSHAVADPTRPSDIFRDFLLSTLGEGDDVRLLFTSEPTRDKVEDFLPAIHPRVGSRAEKGDVRLRFSDKGWTVDAHAIEIV